MAGSSQCVLLDPEVGIICENDHKVGLCLCQFCSCGQHVCPAQSFRPALPTRSLYRTEFVPKRVTLTPKAAPPLRVRRSHKMDLATTHSQDFVPHAVSAHPRRVAPTLSQTLPMVTSSSYSREYKDWGTSPVQVEKHWHPPVHSIPFAGESSYRYSYRQASPGTAARRSRPVDSLSLGLKTTLPANSTYKEAMQRPNGQWQSSPLRTTQIYILLLKKPRVVYEL